MNRIFRIGTALVALMLAVAAAPAAAQDAPTPQALCEAAPAETPSSREFEQADDVLAEGVDYWAVLCTDAGPVVVDLLEDEAPLTVNSFVFLAQQGFYNNTTFHRVLPGFMAQGGDPTGTGSGGPGYTFEDETDNGVVFDQPGLLAMANAGPDTNGSQFFITYGMPSWLDGDHTIFGRVAQGLPEAELLTRRDPEERPEFEGSALETVLILDDPAGVQVTPDAAPDAAHFQAMLETNIVPQLAAQFILSDDASHTYDLEAEAAWWAEQGGDELADFLRAYLGEHQFQGSAALQYTLDACDPAVPIWGLGVGVYDYGAPGEGERVVADDARAEQFVASGAYDSYEDVGGLGRIFQRAVPEDEGCGPNGVSYRLELPYGRYVPVVDLLVDGSVIGAETQPTANDYLGYLLQELLAPAVVSALDRGNTDVAAE